MTDTFKSPAGSARHPQRRRDARFGSRQTPNSESMSPPNESPMNHSIFHLRSLVALGCLITASNTALSNEPSAVSAAEAQHRLDEGNIRFVEGHLASSSPAAIAASRLAVAQDQKPF